MAIAYDTATTSTGSSVNSLSFSHTCTGSDLLLLVAVTMRRINSATVDDVTYNGVSMTLVTTATSGSRYAELWRLAGPATGSNTVAVSLSTTEQEVSAGVMSFTGVDQTTPVGTAATATGSGTTPSVAVSSTTGELVVDALAIENAGTLSVGAGQTSRYNTFGAGGWNKHAGSTEPGAVSTTMSWSDTVGGEWAIIGVPMKPATGGGGGSGVPVKMFQYRMRR